MKGVFDRIPSAYEGAPVTDYGDKIIIPGFCDIHLHAGQLPNMGIGYDCELIDWIGKYAYQVEQSMNALGFAHRCYAKLISDLWLNGITRSVVLGTYYRQTNDLLFQMFMKSGLSAYIGKSVCDRSPTGVADETTENAKQDLLMLADTYKDQKGLVRHILSPTYVPGCTPEIMEFIGHLAQEYDLPVTSHLCENRTEVQEVHRLHPEAPDYASVYREYGLLGQKTTIMAHCIHTTGHEAELLRDCGVYVAHCPHSNLNLSSGVMPLRKYLNMGIRVGLGSDISAGHTLNMMSTMVAAIQGSKMRWMINPQEESVTTREALYLATKGGGSVFGKVGSFEEGYEFDALVIDDGNLYDFTDRTLWERVERFIFRGDDRNIVARYVSGSEVARPQL
ncbi:MAG: amidohydrolase family protein [Clostridia bacterium]|nr:amidohydrolase family protein [Clostridia bacterium]